MSNRKKVLNAAEAADYLGAHIETIRRLARKGEIPAFKLGKDWRFRLDTLDKWADSHPYRRMAGRVLVVDDEASICRSFARIMETEGYEVRTTTDAHLGLEIVEREEIDVVLLDLKMPGMNGAEFLGRLRQIEPDTAVIIVTGFPDSSLMLEAMKYGPMMLLAKPVESSMLLRSIRMALNGTMKEAS